MFYCFFLLFYRGNEISKRFYLFQKFLKFFHRRFHRKTAVWFLHYQGGLEYLNGFIFLEILQKIKRDYTMCSPFLGLIGNYSAASAAGFSPRGFIVGISTSCNLYPYKSLLLPIFSKYSKLFEHISLHISSYNLFRLM